MTATFTTLDRPSCRAQGGVVLVISLLLLLVMTLLGLAAMHMTRMEERMAGNLRDANVAFQGAEAGLRDGENRIGLLTARPDTCAAAPCAVWQRDVLPENMRNQNQTWWNTNAQEYGVSGVHEIVQTTAEPRVVTEEAGFIADSLTVGHAPPEGRNFYKLTARSPGATDTAQAIVESTYTRRY